MSKAKKYFFQPSKPDDVCLTQFEPSFYYLAYCNFNKAKELIEQSN